MCIYIYIYIYADFNTKQLLSHRRLNKLKSCVCFLNQLLQGKTIPKLGSLDQIETGSGEAEGHYSGDCDDEDGCGGSGGGEVKRKVSRVSKCKSHLLLLIEQVRSW